MTTNDKNETYAVLVKSLQAVRIRFRGANRSALEKNL